jgi:hypothetical protein
MGASDKEEGRAIAPCSSTAKTRNLWIQTIFIYLLGRIDWLSSNRAPRKIQAELD